MFEFENKSEKFNIGIQFFAENSDDENEELKNDYLDSSVEKEGEQGDVENNENEQEINFETGETVTPVSKEGFFEFITKNIFDILEVFAYAVSLMVIVFLFVIKFVTVDGTSMLSTLYDDDRLITCNLFYTPETDDIIVINYKERNELIVKRVIGVEGDTVKIKFDTWEIWVNGEYLEQPYLLKNPEYGKEAMEHGHLIDFDDDNSVTITVEKGKVFVLGDNRNHSSDSRVFGQLDIDEILGKVIYRVFPFESVGKVQ